MICVPGELPQDGELVIDPVVLQRRHADRMVRRDVGARTSGGSHDGATTFTAQIRSPSKHERSVGEFGVEAPALKRRRRRNSAGAIAWKPGFRTVGRMESPRTLTETSAGLLTSTAAVVPGR